MTKGVKIWKPLFLALALTSQTGFALSWILSQEAQRLLTSPDRFSSVYPSVGFSGDAIPLGPSVYLL